MNRDVKIGLAIGLLVLVALFVWLALKASREPSTVADISKRPPVKTTGPDLTTSMTKPTKSVGPSAKDYFAPEETAKGLETPDTAAVEMGTRETKSTEELTPAARAYREMLAKSAKTPDTSLKTTETTTMETKTVETAKTPSSHVVKEGETLGMISKTVYGSTRFWERIAKANKIDDPLRVRAGMVLTIPPLSESERPRRTETTREKGKEAVKETFFPTGAGEQHHKVVAGDTLGSISQKYYGTTRHAKLIMEANKLTDENKVRLGKVLVIPKLSTASGVGPVARAAVGGEYVVKDGDTLTSISQLFYGNAMLYPVIMKANKIDNGRDVLMGQKLIIPPKPAGEEAVEETPRREEPTAKVEKLAKGEKDLTGPKLESGEGTYVVEEGDTLGDIAARELGSTRHVGLLMKRNHITDENQVRVGQVLVIPNRTTLHVLSSEARETTPR